MRQTLTGHLFIAHLLFLTVLSACQPAPVHPASTATATATSTPTLIPVSTALPKPTRTLSPSQSTEASAPAATYPATQTPIPETWLTYKNPALNIRLRYPQNWKMQTATRASGPDGFFEISSHTYPASEFDSLVTLCLLDANNPDLAPKYGPFAFISDWYGLGWTGYGCIVSPSETAGSQAALFARDTRAQARNKVLILRADAAHFGGILNSLKFIKFEAPEPSSGNYNSPFCKDAPKAASVTTRQVGDLLISEYAIANATCDPWKHFDGFQVREMSRLMVDRSAIRERDAGTKLETANRALASFGYRIVGSDVFDLLKGEMEVVKNFDNFGPVSVNAAGNDFILWVRNSFNSNASEVRVGAVRTITVWDDGFNSAWVGADIISFDYSKDRLFPGGAPALVNISSNGRKIQAISVPQIGSSGFPVRGLWSWQNHWILETKGVLFQDGELQNLKLGYEEIFDWHLVNGQPFFLMRQGASLGAVYAGQALPVHYDDIIHGDLCCDPARYSVLNSPNGTIFYALRDGVWFLVSIQTAQ